MPIIVEQPSPEAFRNYGALPGTVIDTDLVATLGGVTLGVVDDSGVWIHLSGLDGWWQAVGSSAEVSQRPGEDGGFSTMPYRKPRDIALTIEPRGLDFDHVTPTLEGILAALPLRPDTLTVSKGDMALQATVQLDGDPVVTRQGHQAKITADLVALDPRRYSIDTVTVATGLPQTTGGMSLDGGTLSLPLSIGATTTSGLLSVTNGGNEVTNPVLTVTGPCPPFAIANQATGAILRFADAVADGRSLVIDTGRGLALMDGVATRTVTGTPLRAFAYAPGDNEIAFTADSYDAGALLTSQHRHAYL